MRIRGPRVRAIRGAVAVVARAITWQVRSLRHAYRQRCRQQGENDDVGTHRTLLIFLERRTQGGRCGLKLPTRAGPESALHRWGAVPGDRKSTRLNSSHPSISYAVFCLKKKIKMKDKQ